MRSESIVDRIAAEAGDPTALHKQQHAAWCEANGFTTDDWHYDERECWCPDDGEYHAEFCPDYDAREAELLT